LETLLALQAPGNISFPHPQEFLKQENQKTQMCKLLPGFSINHSWVELNEKALKCQPLQLVSTQSPILGWVPGEAGCQWRGLDPPGLPSGSSLLCSVPAPTKVAPAASQLPLRLGEEQHSTSLFRKAVISASACGEGALPDGPPRVLSNRRVMALVPACVSWGCCYF